MSLKRTALANAARFVLFGVGVILVIVLPVPWVLGSLLAFAVTGHENRSIRETGNIAYPDILQWSDWFPGSGSVVRSSLFEKNDKRVNIVEYRVGTDRKLFAELTFYQARYLLPDGTIELGPADGPKALIGPRQPLSKIVALLAGAGSLLCFWGYVKISNLPQPTKPDAQQFTAPQVEAGTR